MNNEEKFSEAMNNEEEVVEGNAMFFVKKSDLLKNINNIYDSLLDVAYEIEASKHTFKKINREVHHLKKNISHLKSILHKDLIIREDHITENLNLNNIKMSILEWNSYINKSNTNSSSSNNSGTINSDD